MIQMTDSFKKWDRIKRRINKAFKKNANTVHANPLCFINEIGRR